MAAITNRIYIGSLNDPDYYFENDSIHAITTVQNVALVGKELSVDSFTPNVSDDELNLHDVYHFRSSDGHEIELGDGSIFCIDVSDGTNLSELIAIEHGTPVWYYQGDILIGKFYFKSAERVARNQYRLNTVSAVGILDDMESGGGLFLASTFGAVLANILAKGIHGDGNQVIDYSIDDDVADLPVGGWLPKDTKRNNLYRLMFANGVNIVKDISGNPRFTFLYSASETPEEIAIGDIYDQGNVSYERPYTNVVVMEHTYTAVLTEDPVTLFDNTSGTQVSNVTVWFSTAPIIKTTLMATSGLTIVDSGENYAVLSGNGMLTGIPYLVSKREINMGDSSASDEKTIRVEDATFVNLINSENLLLRLYSYYCPQTYIEKISNGIVYNGQRCGKVYKLKDPFGTEVNAFLTSMNITASAINKADCEWIADYEPAGQQGLYQHVVVLVPYYDEEDPETLLYEGDWEVPDGVTEFKVVMIGGGTGGSSGLPGESGQEASTYTEVAETDDLSGVWYGAEGGEGGAGGAGGTPGRVKSVVIENAVAGTSYHWEVGEGGDGGAATLSTTPNAGSDGTASTFGIEGGTTYSTGDEDAYVPTGGVYEPINDEYYALTGNPGIRGGKGGARQIQSGSVFNWVTDGEDVTGEDGTVYRGGSTGRNLTTVSGLSEARILAYGGNGAGAAVGLDRSTNTGMNGGSDQTTSWQATEDEAEGE